MGACHSLMETMSCLNHINIGCHSPCMTALCGAQPCDYNIDTKVIHTPINNNNPH